MQPGDFEPTVNTLQQVKREGGDELVVMEIALSAIIQDHGFSDQEIRQLRDRWNTGARTWAGQQGTQVGHGQKILHDAVWKNVLPRDHGVELLRPLVQDAIQRRIVAIQEDAQRINAEVQRNNAELAFYQQVLGGQD